MATEQENAIILPMVHERAIDLLWNGTKGTPDYKLGEHLYREYNTLLCQPWRRASRTFEMWMWTIAGFETHGPGDRLEREGWNK